MAAFSYGYGQPGVSYCQVYSSAYLDVDPAIYHLINQRSDVKYAYIKSPYDNNRKSSSMLPKV
jgi:hypothetical protein